MVLYENHRNAIVYSLAFAPDGSVVASGAKDGSVLLRDTSGRRFPLAEHDSCSLPVHSVVYTPDGSSVIVGGAFGWLGRRWDGKSWHVFGPTRSSAVNSLAVLDDRTLAVGTGDRVKPVFGRFELWDLATLQRRSPDFPEPNGVRAVAACPEKRMVAWATMHKKVCVWEIVRDRPVEFPQKKNCLAIALAPDGSQLAAAVDYGVVVYAVGKRRELFELKGHKGQVSAVAYSPDGSAIATGSWDSTVKLWDAATGRERATYRWPVGRVYSLAYAPDGFRIAAGDDVGNVVVWDAE